LEGVSGQPEESLKTKHAIQRLESVAKRIEASASQGALAHAQIGSQAIQPHSGRMAIVAGSLAQECDLAVGKTYPGKPFEQKRFRRDCSLWCAARP